MRVEFLQHYSVSRPIRILSYLVTFDTTVRAMTPQIMMVSPPQIRIIFLFSFLLCLNLNLHSMGACNDTRDHSSKCSQPVDQQDRHHLGLRTYPRPTVLESVFRKHFRSLVWALMFEKHHDQSHLLQAVKMSKVSIYIIRFNHFLKKTSGKGLVKSCIGFSLLKKGTHTWEMRGITYFNRDERFKCIHIPKS